MCLINPLNAELNPICHLLALLGAHHILHVSRIRVKKGKSCTLFLDSSPLRMGTIGCLETSLKNCHYTLRNDPEERISYLFRSGILNWHSSAFLRHLLGNFRCARRFGRWLLCVWTDITLPSSLHEFGLGGKLRFRLVLKLSTRGAQISVTKSPRWLDFVRWSLIFVNPQYGICFSHPSGFYNV